MDIPPSPESVAIDSKAATDSKVIALARSTLIAMPLGKSPVPRGDERSSEHRVARGLVLCEAVRCEERLPRR